MLIYSSHKYKPACGCVVCVNEREQAREQFHDIMRGCIVVIMTILLGIFLTSGCAHASTSINLGIIAKIESGGHPRAFNRHSGATGLYQITPICLKDYNNHHKAHQLTIKQMYLPLYANTVAIWYFNYRIPLMLESYGIIDNTTNRLWAYNAGIGRIKHKIMPDETKRYIAKYKILERSNS